MIVAMPLPQVPRSAAPRGYGPVYHRQGGNRCPGCGRSQWLVGRVLAECGCCGTALPLEGAREALLGDRRSAWS